MVNRIIVHSVENISDGGNSVSLNSFEYSMLSVFGLTQTKSDCSRGIAKKIFVN